MRASHRANLKYLSPISGLEMTLYQTFRVTAISVPAAIATTASRLLNNPSAILLFLRHLRRQRSCMGSGVPMFADDGVTGQNQPGLNDVPITLWIGTKLRTPERRERRRGQPDREGQFQYCRPPCTLPLSHIAERERRTHRRGPAEHRRLQQTRPKASSIQRVAHDESVVAVERRRFRKLTYRLSLPRQSLPRCAIFGTMKIGRPFQEAPGLLLRIRPRQPARAGVDPGANLGGSQTGRPGHPEGRIRLAACCTVSSRKRRTFQPGI